MEAIMDTIVDSLFCFFVTLGEFELRFWRSRTEESEQRITCLPADLKLSNLPSRVLANSFLFLSPCFSVCPLGGSVSLQSG